MLTPKVRACRPLRPWPELSPLLALLVLTAPLSAHAGSVSNEVGGQATQTTPSNPRAGNMADLLKADFDLTDVLVLRSALGFTCEFATPPTTGGCFAGTHASIFAMSVGLDYDNQALTLSIDGVYSPPARRAPIPTSRWPRRTVARWTATAC